jgi:AhpD family alkylhydroperoxidase
MPEDAHDHGPDVLADLRPLGRDLRQQIPEVYKAFATLRGAAMAAGAVDAKTKELIALAISVSSQCDGCIADHARGAHRAGATVEEVAETLGVTVLMSGGPATVYAPRALAAFEAFSTPPPGAPTGE